MRDRNAPLSYRYRRVYESKYVEESQTRWTIAFNMSKEETTTTIVRSGEGCTNQALRRGVRWRHGANSKKRCDV
eukprot:scaffold44378_cov146-Skeletonema_marinoi.AAC.1